MSEDRLVSTIKTVLFILAVIAVALIITHTDEIGQWLTKILADSYESQIEQILR